MTTDVLAPFQADRAPAPSRAARVPALVRDALRLTLVLAGLLAIFAGFCDGFLSARTATAIAYQIPALLVAAVGMTLVLVLGQIDLSVGSVLGFAGALLGVLLVKGQMPLPVAILAAIAGAAALGAVSALVMTTFTVPSFIVTLGMLEAARGGTFLITSSQTQYIGGGIERIAEASLLGVPAPFLFAVLIAVAAQVGLSRTVAGRLLIATGTNEEAVRLTGINTRRIKITTFVLSGALAGIAAVLHTARLGAADPNAGTGFELQAIAAVVIGGTSLLGGRGGVVGSVLGVLIIATLDTGLAQIGAQEPAKRLTTGLVIVAAVVLDNLRHRQRAGAGAR